VVAYAMSLSTKEGLVLGQSIYIENCQTCHGTNGEGTASAPGWKADTSLLAMKSLDDLAGIISNGQGQMPAFSDRLNQEEINTVSIAVRWLGFASGAVAVETPQPEVGVPAASATTEAPVDVTPNRRLMKKLKHLRPLKYRQR
jgi:mono/diheme cytochrome c family protein